MHLFCALFFNIECHYKFWGFNKLLLMNISYGKNLSKFWQRYCPNKIWASSLIYLFSFLFSWLCYAFIIVCYVFMQWVKLILIDYCFEAEQFLRFDVLNADTSYTSNDARLVDLERQVRIFIFIACKFFMSLFLY